MNNGMTKDPRWCPHRGLINGYCDGCGCSPAARLMRMRPRRVAEVDDGVVHSHTAADPANPLCPGCCDANSSHSLGPTCAFGRVLAAESR